MLFYAPPHSFSASPSPPPAHHSSSPPHHPSPFPHYAPPFPPPSGSLEGLRAHPPHLQGPKGQALEYLHTGLVSSSPQVPK